MNASGVRRDSCGRGAAAVAVLACLVASAAGCRTGSWMSKPSWMSFGQKSTDPDRLTSAPAFAGDVTKPSATAKPYPTTSTPDSYSLPAATSQAATAPGGIPAAVTYGSTPPPAAVAETPPPAVPAAGTTASVAPQVGPYAASAGSEPSAPPAAAAPASSPWTSTAAAAGAQQPDRIDPAPATVSTAPPPWAAAPAAASPPPRYADARAASPGWTPAPLEPQSADGRYAASGTSRFGGGEMPAAASMLPQATPAAIMPSPPAELQPAPPAAAPPGAPTAPSRRPDPGYRPGGTSSYRPARSSLAGEPDSGVQPAAFEADARASF